MTGWIILLIILGIIAFILFTPAVVDFRYEGGKTAVKVSYCGFTLFDSTKKKPPKTPEQKKADREKKRLKKKQKEEKAQKKKQKQDEKNKKLAAKGKPVPVKEKRKLSEILEFVISLLQPVGKGMRRLFKGIRITRFYLDIKVGAFDAYDCAVQYGRICTVVSNALQFFQSFFSVKSDHIEVLPRFGTESTVYTARFRAKASPSAVLAAGFALGWTYLKNSLRSPQNNNTSPKNKEDSKNGNSE